jgi:uncharacterized protein (DUF1684 family)
LNFQNRKIQKLFVLPFSDLTGNESYIGGKYIDLTMPKGILLLSISINRIIHIVLIITISCPKVPLENDLNIAISGR